MLYTGSCSGVQSKTKKNLPCTERCIQEQGECIVGGQIALWGAAPRQWQGRSHGQGR